jgi:hypothetical protein
MTLMKRTYAVMIVSLMFGGAAYADHWHGGGGGHGPVVRDHREGPAPAPVVVRDHRNPGPAVGHDRRPEGGVAVRDHRGGGYDHVRVNNGRYVFPGGVVRVYQRPVIREHYYNVRVRPPLIVESYEPVPGYMWMAGSWGWGGAEWVWNPGYWAVAEQPAPAPVVEGGVGISVGAGISIH